MQKNNLIVKEPEELILMRGNFSESALKLGAYLIAILEKGQTIYEINIKEYLTNFDKKIGNYNYLYNVAKELSQRQFEIKDRFNEKFVIFNFVSSASYADGILEIEFSQRLLFYLLDIKDKYLKYNIKNIMSLSSKYIVRLYKILKDELEKNSRYGNKAEKIISINKLREMLEIPKSYQYGNSSGIKKRILEKSQTEIEKHTDIIFNFEEIKTGRRISHIKFVIQENPKKVQEIPPKLYLKSFKNFTDYLRKKYAGNQKTFFVGNDGKTNKLTFFGIDNNYLLYGFVPDEIEITQYNSIESMQKYEKFYKVVKNSEFFQDLIESELDLYEIYKDNRELFNILKQEIIDILKK